jgi:hypothetical protein
MCLLGQQARQNPSREERERSSSTKVIKTKIVSRTPLVLAARWAPDPNSHFAKKAPRLALQDFRTGVLHKPCSFQQGFQT